MARSATGVVRVPLQIKLFRDRSNHPRCGLRPWLPSLFKEGSVSR